MDKALIKLIAAGLSLALAVTVAVMSTYAWFTLTTSPEVAGATVVIGGSNTIMLAPNVTSLLSIGEEVTDVRVNYPGEFSDTLVFSSENGYDLSAVAGLAPVSTADGVSWIIPIYSTGEDGTFVTDTMLNYANQTQAQMDAKQAQGNYVYLDFWVVAPAADYRLRVSAGEDGEGSYLIGLPVPEAYDADGNGITDSYRMVEGNVSAAASARVGFLANQQNCNNYDLLAYENSEHNVEDYKRLKGYMTDKGTIAVSSENRFTIYEPNGTLHEGETNGTYLVTQPLNASGISTDIQTILTVQDTNTWKTNENGTVLEQSFAAVANRDEYSDYSAEELASAFYAQGQISSYVNTGKFFANTSNLYTLASQINSAWLETERANEESANLAGATSDVYIIDLEKNVPQRIRMFIWLEAEDYDCGYDAQETSFALRIELAGSSMSE